jgi:MYXO-CTERM domain-containing protein
MGDGDLYDHEMGNFSHDAEVWLHEQGHGVTGEVTPFDDHEMRSEDVEFDALHEGLADYAAAAYTGNTNVLEWVAANFPDSHRPVDEPMHYDEFEADEDEHLNGRIISSLGWRIRGRIAGAADFEALTLGMLMADEDVHDGRYAVPILESLDAHGLEANNLSWGAVPEPELSGPVRKNQPITLDGDTLNGIVGYSWEVLDAPEDSGFVELTGEERWDSEVTFTPDVCGIWTLQLRVSNSDWQLTDAATVEVATCGAGCGCDSAVAGGAGAGAMALVLIGGGLVLRRRRD